MPADTGVATPAAISPLSPLKRLYTFPEAREATTFSRALFYKLEASGHIRLVRFGSKTLVPIEAIDAILTGKLDRKDNHRAQHWHGAGSKPGRRRGRPRKPPTPETAPTTADRPGRPRKIPELAAHPAE
jgi:hypothetical protein